MLNTRLSAAGRIVANVLSLCWPNDRDRVTNYINRAVERLLYEGKWKGTIARYQVRLSDGCAVWPREIETIEAFAVCGRPGTPRNMWFEFLGNGPGTLGSLCNGKNLIDQGDVCSFDNIKGTGKQLAVYCDRQEAVGKTITLQYLDSGGQFVTSVVTSATGTTVIDGETITLPAAGTYAYTSRAVAPNGFLRCYKDETIGTVRVYEYDPTTTLLRPLAYYQRDELDPIYRRSIVPGVSSNASCGAATSVEVMAKIRFIPVWDDNDYLVISYPEAIRLACQGVLKEENGKFEEAGACFGIAMRLLDRQLAHYRGSGAVAPVQFRDGHMPAVQNII